MAETAPINKVKIPTKKAATPTAALVATPLDTNLPQKPITFARVAVEKDIKPAYKKAEIAQDLCRSLAEGRIKLGGTIGCNNEAGNYCNKNGSDYMAKDLWFSLNYNTNNLRQYPQYPSPAEKTQESLRFKSARKDLIKPEKESGEIRASRSLSSHSYEVYACQAPEFLVIAKGPRDHSLDVPEAIANNPDNFLYMTIKDIAIDEETGKAKKYESK